MIKFLLIVAVTVVVFEESKVEGQRYEGYFKNYEFPWKKRLTTFKSRLHQPKYQFGSNHNQRSILYTRNRDFGYRQPNLNLPRVPSSRRMFTFYLYYHFICCMLCFTPTLSVCKRESVFEMLLLCVTQ